MSEELQSLLTYLRISLDSFTPVETQYFARLKELLVFNGIITPTDPVDRTNISDLVKEFQRNKMDIQQPDGIPGEETLWELQKQWTIDRKLKLVSTGIPNDAFQGSTIPFVLRSDVLPFYEKLYHTVHENGGMVTSTGSLRPINATVSAGRSATSMHYTGIALDLDTNSGMTGAASGVYLIEKAGTKHWNVWNKVVSPMGSSRADEVVYHPATKSISVNQQTAQVIDFTDIARQNGFSGIGSRACFPETYLCAEWWHFQCEDVLVPFISQFGAELLAVYDERKLVAQAPIWNSRKKIFKRDWF
ncbi:hypothetical protein SNE25_21370 [Mucilaginibacter sabulilitoris]|uniref:Peptidoglycan binding-like domain-containing protein n=1 Tax=Mucilaginibacter sabulilitoris TaxID=1173583 RepID=A0ABZ0TL29_9SPHI|nr:hypothetical protein [Mucilaginibacter sabulilitoris]WPU91870.1 hypothetical protein SNE25_21370 [Mucilaginibacter sabulilitoris]